MVDESTSRDVTESLQLIKPRLSEAVRVFDINSNSDVIDTAFGSDRHFSKITVSNSGTIGTNVIPKSNKELSGTTGWSISHTGDTLSLEFSNGVKADSDSTGRKITITHTNSISSGTVGTSKAGIRMWYDSQGHITQTSSFDMFPPLKKGVDGQVWTSSGAGSDNGTWRDLKGANGISVVNGTSTLTIGHSSTYSKGTIGSSTSIPSITLDDFGHVSVAKNNTVYPPVTKGDDGQLWASTGSGSSANNKKSGCWTTLTAEEGIILTKSSTTDGKLFTLGHTNKVSAQAVGSGTSIPVLSIDSNGHVSSIGSSTVYPPTEAGNSNDIWVSSGSGVGKWVDPANITVGASTIANRLRVNAVGSITAPVYISNGQPVAIPYEIKKSVPADAKFTDTTYTGEKGVVLTGTSFSVDSADAKSTSSTKFVSANLLQNIIAGSGKVYSSNNSLDDRLTYIEAYLDTSYDPSHPSEDKTLLERMATAEQNIAVLDGVVKTARSKTALEDSEVLATHKILTLVKNGLDSDINAINTRTTALETLTSTHTSQITNLSNVVNTNMLKSVSLTLSPSDWSENTATKAVSNMKASSIVWVAFQGTGTESAVENEVSASAQADGKLTFSCTNTPDTAVVADVVYT